MYRNARRLASTFSAFRDDTVFPFDMADVNWFPGHMRKAMRKMNEKAKCANVILEVRDSRAPMSSANPELLPIMKNRKHIIVFNKVDLVRSAHRKSVESHFKRVYPDAIIQFSNGALIHSMRRLLKTLCTECNPKFKTVPSVVLVVGFPNVGKSTIINALRYFADKRSTRRGSAKTGPLAGVTRHVSGFMVKSSPPLFLIDSPGIFVPKKKQAIVTGLNLALLACVPTNTVDPIYLAQYLLHKLNANGVFHYVKRYKLDAPVPHERVYDLLKRVVTLSKGIEFDEAMARNSANRFLSMFRKGEIGKILVDDTEIFKE